MFRSFLLDIFCFISVVCFGSCQVDRTRQKDAYGQLVVDTTIRVLREACVVQDHLFMRRLAYYESNFGIKNSFGSNNGGIWRVDKGMLNATQSASSRLQSLYLKIKTSLNIDWTSVTWDDMRRPLHSALAAILYIESIAVEPIPVKLEYQAAFWKKYYRQAGDPNAFTATIQTLIEGCANADQADIAFILETSMYMTVKDLAQSMLLMKNLVSQLNIDPNLTRVALVTFGDKAQVKLHLSSDKNKVLSEIAKMTSTSGSVNAKDALNLTLKEVFNDMHGARKGASHTTILLTKSRPDDPQATKTAASLLTGSGSRIYVLSVGTGGNDSSLMASASSPNCEHFVHAPTFEELMNHETEILEKICEESALLQDGIYSYPCNVDALVEVPYSPYGHFITVTVPKGERTLFGSASYDVPDETIYDVKETVSASSPWSVFWTNNSAFHIYVKSTFGQTCTGTYTVNVKVGPHTTIPPTTTTVVPTKHVDLLCRENGVIRNCTKDDILHSKYASVVSSNKTSPSACVNNKTVQPHPHDPTRFLLCDPVGQLLTVQCPPHEYFCTATNLCERSCSATAPNSNSPALHTTATATPPGQQPTTTTPANSTATHILLVFTNKPFVGSGTGSTPGIYIRTKNPPTSTKSSQTLLYTTISQPVVSSSPAPHQTSPAPQVTSHGQQTTTNCHKNPCTASALLKGLMLFPACDESSFYHCKGFGAGSTLENCPPDKIFNPAVPGCVNKYVFDEDSQQYDKTIPNPCKTVTGDVFFAHPSDQTKFIHCDGFWNGFMRSCSTGQIYSPFALSCVGAAAVVG